MHSGTYSGEMYWCCGKTEPDAPGCKIRKHESRDDEDEEEEDKDKEFTSTGTLICSSCKELGHNANDCPRDPNARTKENMVDEVERMS
mmetsp:Transcript_9022/g.1315  ORF Transcript_9022/g.1315 Transcript_9022/m.1315 type:complete len:88 (-) Transcript_9022:306-569(-)